MKVYKKFTNVLLSLMLILVSVGIQTFDVNAEEEDVLYYNDFKNYSGEWDSFKGKMNYVIENNTLIIENIENDSILINKDDAIRNSGDVELTFTYNNGDKCFGPTFRADPNDPEKWQSVVFVENAGDKSKWILGQPNGGWKNIESDIILKDGVQYRLLVKYIDNRVSVYLNGNNIFDDNLVFENGVSLNGEWQGQTGIRKHCNQQKVVIDKFISGPYDSIPLNGFGNMYANDFEESIGQWEQYKGDMKVSHKDKKLHINNTTQESLIINLDDDERKSGDIELDFTYSPSLRCFGPIFRADQENKANWQAFAYMGNEGSKSKWSLGQPGGKWINFVSAPALKDGEQYKLVIRYNENTIEAYLNGDEIYNEVVDYGGDKGMIDGDWSGVTGIRKHCVSGEMMFDRIISAEYNTIPNEGLMKVVTPRLSLKEPEIPIVPVEPEENLKQYAIMRDKWRIQKVGDFNEADLKDPEINNYLENLNFDSQSLLNTIKLDEDRNTLWDKKSSDTISANMTTQFKNLSILARAYGTKGSKYYEDNELLEIIKSALEFLTGPNWYDGKKLTGNWWDWQIGVAQEFVDILMIMHDDLSSEEVEKYGGIISAYVPNAERQINGSSQGSYVGLSFGVKATGANRTDLALTYLATGILLEKEEIVKSIVPSIESVFQIVNSGDGFYSDGSFIQHNDIPYTGSYGNVLVKGVGKILSILEGSQWQMDEKKIDDFSSLVYNAFIPIIYKGETMPMFGGRSISRAPSPRKTGFGSATIYNLLIVSNFASEPYKTQLKEAAKYWINEDKSDYYYNNNRDLRDLLEVKNVMKDESIKGESVPFIGSKIYGAADRFVHTSQNFSLGVSMHSNRISAFESGNKENKKAWFTSDGMIYLQNQDRQFSESYWPTVDWYRLPGTTVDTRKLTDSMGSFQRMRSKEDWVGGSSSGVNSSVGMKLNKHGFKNNNEIVGYDLMANKSWFVVDDKILSLGSNINGTSPSSIETIVENRMLDKDMNYELIGNIDVNDSEAMTVQKGDWIMLKSSNNENNIAYLFLDEHNINIVKEERTGKYSDINGAFVNDKIYREAYQKIIVDHGSNVENGSYSYVLIPSVSEDYMRTLNVEDFNILNNDEKIQSIEYGDVLLANVWDSEGGTVKEISSDTSASMVIEENDREFKLFISNPEQNDKKITLDINRNDLIFAEADKTVKHIGDSSRSQLIKIEIDTSNSIGKTHQITFKKKVDDQKLLDLVNKYNDVEIDNLTAYSLELYKDILNRAQNILNSKDTNQQMIDDIVEEMEGTFTLLEYKLNFKKAEKFIKEYENLNKASYTEETYTNLEIEVVKLLDLISQYDETKPLKISQEDINQQLAYSIDALHSLNLISDEDMELDFSKLENLIEHYEELESSYYTEDSWNELVAIINIAQGVMKEGGTNQKEIDELSQKVIKSILELKYRENEDEEDLDLDDKEDNDLPNGGSTNNEDQDSNQSEDIVTPESDENNLEKDKELEATNQQNTSSETDKHNGDLPTTGQSFISIALVLGIGLILIGVIIRKEQYKA